MENLEEINENVNYVECGQFQLEFLSGFYIVMKAE